MVNLFRDDGCNICNSCLRLIANTAKSKYWVKHTISVQESGEKTANSMY